LEIYRPGSGPLRRSGNSRQDADDDDKRSMFTGFSRDLDSSKKSDFIPNKHFENPNRKKENFPRSQSKTNGFTADNYSTFNLKRKQQKKTQPFYEPPNEWSSDKRPDRPRVNFVNPDDSKDDNENWRTHKAPKAVSVSKVSNAPKVVSVPKVVKKIEEKPIQEKITSPVENIPTMVINTRVNITPAQNIPEKVPGYGNRKREEKKMLNNKINNFTLLNYDKWPPRMRKKFLEDNHITVEEMESYLSNGIPSQDDNNKQHSSYQSRSLPPRSGKGHFNEPRHHEQVLYGTNCNNQPPPPKTETRRMQQSTAQCSNESNRRGVDFDLHTKMRSPQNTKTKTDTEDNFSVTMKQSLESTLLLPSGTIVSFNFVSFH